ncbi:MAG TPA: helicase associated domain-containing protein, partial [Haliangiales bacterium]|nr:helicase associated domain-containing protein [Haliangiales bacterium]
GFTRDLAGIKPQELWPMRYGQLVEFKKQYGHCNVPYNYSENRQLGIWVSNQRCKRKQHKLTPEREKLLNEVGFVWSVAPRDGRQTFPTE